MTDFNCFSPDDRDSVFARGVKTPRLNHNVEKFQSRRSGFSFCAKA